MGDDEICQRREGSGAEMLAEYKVRWLSKVAALSGRR